MSGDFDAGRSRDDVLRWGGGLLIAGLLHAVAIGGALYWRDLAAEPPSGGELAMMIDLAPPEPAPPAEPAPPPPEPEAEPPPPEPPPPEPTPPEPPPPVEDAAVPLPPPPPPTPVVKPKPVEKPVEKKQPPRPRPTPAPAAAAAAPAAPAEAPPAPPSPHVAQSWQSKVLAHLERRKRYPRGSQFRREEGVVKVRFVINKDGEVLSFRLEGSSGYAELDEETLSLIERASPLPAPPLEIARDRLEMVVPVRFALR